MTLTDNTNLGMFCCLNGVNTNT